MDRAAAPLEAFCTLSANLTGFPVAALNRDFADALWRALSDAGHRPTLETLLGGDRCAGCEALEIDIVAAWYSGVLPAPSGGIVATLHDALIWKAASFASPPSVQGLGWERPPDAQAPQ